MNTQTLLFIILAGIIALCVALFQYFYKSTPYKKLNIAFSFLRFTSVFLLLLLIINPQYERNSYETVKPVLAIGIDNSASIAYLKQDSILRRNLEELRNNKELQQRFDIDYYKFGSGINTLEKQPDFSADRTDISKPLQSFASIYKTQYVPLLITDGNTTLGADYEYSTTASQPVYFIAVGDTLTYEDLKIDRINVNRYAYQNNQFPVELIASYTGEKAVNTVLEVFADGQKVYSKKLQFSERKNGEVVNFYLPAKNVGLKQYSAQLRAVANEKNTTNNSKNFAVEVIDQKAKIALVYSYMHPDLGALKKSIESNELREVSLIPVTDFTQDEDAISAYDLIILFEPDARFSALYASLKRLDKNRFTIAAAATDYSFLNKNQNVISKNITRQEEEVQAYFNTNFSAFLVEDLDFQDFPPLETAFGETSINGDTDVLLYKKIGAVRTESPLLTVSQQNERREVVLLGTGLWKWRAASFLKNQSFEAFDNFLDKLVQFALSSDKKSRLRMDYDSFYYGSESIKIQAQYVDDNYNFDRRAGLSLELFDENNQKVTEVPMLLQNNYYEAVFNRLDPGSYTFKVSVKGASFTEKGKFSIIPYNIEQQAQNANWAKIKRTAEKTKGMAVTLNNKQTLIRELLDDEQFIPTQKELTETVDLVDFKFLLYIIAALLALEWFIRKYNGLV